MGNTSNDSASRPSFEGIRRRHAHKFTRLSDLLVTAQQNARISSAERVLEMRAVVSGMERAMCSRNSRLVAIGSLANSLVFDQSSDVDVCFVPLLPPPRRAEFNAEFHQNISFKEHMMRVMLKRLSEDKDVGGELLDMDGCLSLYRAKVPILVVKYKTGISVDIQFSSDSYHAIRNTNLIRHYVVADDRFGMVYMWLRTLFRSLGIMRSKEGLFSSYHVLCLVAHFLQCKSGALSKPVLPVLSRSHSHLVDPSLDVDKVIAMLDKPIEECKLNDWHSENTMSVGELCVRLIDYYANMDIHRCAISLDKGTLERKKQPSSANWLQMFDPYSKMNVCRRRDAGDAFQRAIEFIMHRMHNGDLLDSFPSFPEANAFQLRGERIRRRFTTMGQWHNEDAPAKPSFNINSS